MSRSPMRLSLFSKNRTGAILGTLLVTTLFAISGGGASVIAAQSSTAAVSPESSGSHGHSLVPVTIDSSDNVHWYAGGKYSGQSEEAGSILTLIWAPRFLPHNGNCTTSNTSGDCYFLLLSAFDSTGSYDQIGIGADNGGWWVAYSYSTNDGGCPSEDEYNSTLEAVPVAPDTPVDVGLGVVSYFNGTENKWDFGIGFQAAVDGKPIFEKVDWNGPVVASFTEPQEWLKADPTQPCGGGKHARGYTVYEEVWSAVGGAPNTTVYFNDSYFVTSKDPTLEYTDWKAYKDDAPKYVVPKVYASGDFLDVQVLN